MQRLFLLFTSLLIPLLSASPTQRSARDTAPYDKRHHVPATSLYYVFDEPSPFSTSRPIGVHPLAACLDLLMNDLAATKPGHMPWDPISISEVRRCTSLSILTIYANIAPLAETQRGPYPVTYKLAGIVVGAVKQAVIDQGIYDGQKYRVYDKQDNEIAVGNFFSLDVGDDGAGNGTATDRDNSVAAPGPSSVTYSASASSPATAAQSGDLTY